MASGKCSSSCAPGSEGQPSAFGMDPRTFYFTLLAVACTPFAIVAFVKFAAPAILHRLGGLLGYYLLRKTEGRRSQILKVVKENEITWRIRNPKSANPKTSTSEDDDWENIDQFPIASSNNGEKDDKQWGGVVGFFHPFCNAGGGGERVLWAAIRATQKKWPNAKIMVYTGDHGVTKDQMLYRVKNRFNIHLYPPTITFLYLSTRHWVLASTWPRFTLLGQSLGSVILAYDALSLLVPDIFIDTMGYAFALGFCKLLFPNMPTGAYVHYPTISTDMLDSLDPTSRVGSQGVNAGKGVGAQGVVKKYYWKAFANLYSRVGSSIDVVMTNSSWTQGHVQSLWGPRRREKKRAYAVSVVYPPVAVGELEKEIEVSAASEAKREKLLLYIAQFRPEKNHQMIVESFAKFLKSGTEATKGAKLILVGSVRDDQDSKRVYELRLLVNELHIKDSVEFHLDAPWPAILDWLRKSYVGVNGMWNEHFGIGVVEYQAAGLISVVHDSGGPKLDIVATVEGEPTGFHASNVDEFAEGYEKALSLREPLAWRRRAQISARRFTDEIFARKWIEETAKLVELQERV